MKKIYLEPNIKVVRVEQHLLEGASKIEKYSAPVTVEDDVLSRKSSSIWDDEE